MAIYRGTGGANEATDLATNQAVIAKEYAEQAANAATQANLTLDSFQDIYLGPFGSNPTTDNDGNALQVGALYFNTSDQLLRVWNGMNWLVSAVSEPSSFTRNTFSGTGSQTVFTLSSTPVNNDSVFVFISGVLTSAYNVSGTTLTFTTAPASGTNNILAIVASTVSTLAPADNSVSTAKLQEGAVTTSKIGDLQITTAKVADAGITTAKLADNTITTAKVTDGNITLAKLASNSVDSSKIVDGSVGSAELASNAVTTVKITDANVTTAKLADGAVTGSKLENIISSGSIGGASSIPIINFDTKGRITSTSSSPLASLGTGQTWQNFTGTKSLGTSYTNSTGKPIEIKIQYSSSSGTASLLVNIDSAGTFPIATTAPTASATGVGSIIIPNGSTYVLTVSSGSPTVGSWYELR